MKDAIADKLPPMSEAYKLSEDQIATLNRLREELVHRLGGITVSIRVFKENYLAYPSIGGDMIHFEVQIGRRKWLQAISEMELDGRLSGSFYYFCRRLVDNAMAEILKIGAACA